MDRFKKRIAILLCLLFIAPSIIGCIPAMEGLTVAQAQAAAKAKLYKTKGTIGICSTPEYLSIENYNSKAKYTYASANKKIATVTKDGVINGVAKGKTTITVTETVGKKKTKIGTFTVTVAAAKLAGSSIEIGAGSGGYIPLQYANFKAAYSYKSADSAIAKVDKYGVVTGIKEGKTSITVYETYNKKKVTIGKLTVNVKNPSIEPGYESIEIGLHSSNSLMSLIAVTYWNWNASYTCESADESIVVGAEEFDSWGYSSYNLKAVGEGSTTITIYCETNGTKIQVGTVAVTVKDFPATSFKFSSDGEGIFTKTYYVGVDNTFDPLSYYIITEPLNATTPVTYTSSDETIATVDSKGIVTAHTAGTVEITATCGNFTDKMVIEVKSNEDYYNDLYDAYSRL